MSALARYFRACDIPVAGYDRVSTTLTSRLEQEGIKIHYEDNPRLMNSLLKSYDQDRTLVIYTPAIPKGMNEFLEIQQQGYKLLKRSQALGIITENTFNLSVAGTHGKTTTSCLLAHILKSAEKDIAAFLGGIAKNYNTNYISTRSNTITVTEADEFDRSFLQLHPDIAIISSADPDHLDIYGTAENFKEGFNLFVKRIKKGGTLVLKQELDLNCPEDIKVVRYSLEDSRSQYFAKNIIPHGLNYKFDLVTPQGIIEDMLTGIGGLHNVENAIGAAAAALIHGIDADKVKQGISSYQGVARRYDVRIVSDKIVYIDDYAHHPRELSACISSVRSNFPDKKITGVFQPHLYTRTRDFEEGFAESLSMLDEVILLDIYPARELPIEGVTSERLLKKITIGNKSLMSKEELLNQIKTFTSGVLVTLGAGDIDQLVAPIESTLKDKLNE